eukprot:gb/GECG01008419.1/.p1 GENE.gb/GECG01008419.1/~~gb/GECG01008419.1/.p1  ORF type:complete len:460 (+),score=40.76 gb/GECG01008419.1/:1-1380(+)
MSIKGDKWNLDNLLAFKTPRFVRIRDRRLGIMNIIFGTSIFGYIVGYLVFWQQQFNEATTSLGFRRGTLTQPSEDIVRPPEELDYCGNGTYKADVSNAVESPQAACQYLGQYGAQYPRQQSDGIFISTRITTSHYKRNSSRSCAMLEHPDCRYEKQNESNFYVADVEYFTLQLDHSLIVTDHHWSSNAWTLHGRMLDSNGNNVDVCEAYDKIGKTCPSDIHIGEMDVYDRVSIATLLSAAGVESLDSAGGDVGTIQDQTHRFAGMVLLLEIHYDNYFSYNPSNVRYTIRVHAIKNTGFEVEQPLHWYDFSDMEKTVFLRYGIEIVVKQTGTIGWFNFVHLLTVLVTSLGLLAVSSTLVNFTAFSLLPLKYVYRQYRQIDSAHFEEIKRLPDTYLRRFKGEDLLNPRPRVFDAVSPDEPLLPGAVHLETMGSSRQQRESGKDSRHLLREPLLSQKGSEKK